MARRGRGAPFGGAGSSGGGPSNMWKGGAPGFKKGVKPGFSKSPRLAPKPNPAEVYSANIGRANTLAKRTGVKPEGF